MRELRRIGVYCGSNFGTGDAYRAAASALGTELARRRIGLVYGGTHKGLMGVLADAVIAAGGATHGVITRRPSVRLRASRSRGRSGACDRGR